MKKLINVTVLPRSSRNEIISLPDGSYKIKLTAPPIDGEANEELIKLLSREWNLARSSLTIVKGMRGKRKVVEVDKN